jgi:hypothetical protein
MPLLLIAGMVVCLGLLLSPLAFRAVDRALAWRRVRKQWKEREKRLGLKVSGRTRSRSSPSG